MSQPQAAPAPTPTGTVQDQDKPYLPHLRRVVQVHRVIGEENAKWQGVLITTVVCNDGSVWERWNDGRWERLPGVPQDEPARQPALAGLHPSQQQLPREDAHELLQEAREIQQQIADALSGKGYPRRMRADAFDLIQRAVALHERARKAEQECAGHLSAHRDCRDENRRLMEEHDRREKQHAEASRLQERRIGRMMAEITVLQQERVAAVRALEERGALGNETPTQLIPVHGAAVVVNAPSEGGA